MSIDCGQEKNEKNGFSLLDGDTIDSIDNKSRFKLVKIVDSIKSEGLTGKLLRNFDKCINIEN